ncbi:MAG: DUF1116 domain-containing protein [Armatimonadota bacterium]|nr:DUF1116 domain-containing protein [Armatimonadota bacterium]MDR7533135.1 DUF1116 domain-containing protein [Armatimonadota bacterium]MDR7536619.1 DUF1116 domain-containing protein [Armatimonadota bacterium]
MAAANAEALRRLEGAAPVLVGLRPARAVIPPLAGDRAVLHAGPPVAPAGLCGPMRGAMVGAALYEGWAATPDEAAGLLDRGEIALQHCTHDWGVVAPMAGVVSPSMPLFEVRDDAAGHVAYGPINEGIGAVLRFGAYGPPVIERLRWLQDVLAPALDAALRRAGGVPLVPLMARALAMGDEMHQRNVAATSLFLRQVAPLLAEVASGAPLAAILRFLAEGDQFFLNLAMVAAKTLTLGIQHLPGCTLVSAMSRNGVEFGLRVSGLGDRWFTAPAPTPEGLYFSGYGAADANPDMGDSAIVETVGLGGFAMAAAPAVAGFLGLASVGEAAGITRAMGEITAGRSARFLIPSLEFEGTPLGIDVRAVVRLGVTPVINTGIAHRAPGIGQIGAGVVRAPLQVFEQALAALAAALEPAPGHE